MSATDFPQTAVPQRRGPWIDAARRVARGIALSKGRVTIDDVREICPPPEGVDPRIMGSVFAQRQFLRIGFELSGRAACHGRPIGIFRLRRPGEA